MHDLTLLQVFRAAGPKWKLAYELAHKPEWPELTRGKKAIMVADDDLEMDTCILNRCWCSELLVKLPFPDSSAVACSPPVWAVSKALFHL